MSNNDTAKISVFPGNRAPSRVASEEALERALTRVAPLWPLENFVAVNPFLGFTDESFDAAGRRVTAACNASLTMPRSFYRDALQQGRIETQDLLAALSRRGLDDSDLGALRAHADSEAETEAPFPTLSDIAAAQTGTDWPGLVTDRISHWAAGYFDAGQASWTSPFAALPPFQAWLRETRIDSSDAGLGLRGIPEFLQTLPEDPQQLFALAIDRLAVPEEQLDLYLHRLLMTIGGWVAHARYRSWQDELGGAEPRWVLDLLAVRLAWELMLLESFRSDGVELAWRRELSASAERFDAARWDTPARTRDQLLHEAYEIAWERQMLEDLRSGATSEATARPEVQAVFCIDVRSEVLRRAFEATGKGTETLGFAGFFGLPVEYVPLAGESAAAHCPVLLKPALSIRESVPDKPAEIANRLSRRIRLRRQLGRGWRAFKNSAVSCFVFVESYGLAYGLKLISHTLGLSRPEPLPAHRGLPPHLAGQLGPQLVPGDGESEGGLALERQVDFAEAMLRGMSLTRDFARLVMLAGHGSSTTNNAHASGYDCGACGGQTGETSARIAAMILNNAAVRSGLAERGIAVPEDSWFMAALHNTTTDEVELFDTSSVPASHAEDLAVLRERLKEAGEQARQERARLLSMPPQTPVHKGVRQRARDWSQVRPEWGLAGCAAFVAAPRGWTRNLDLGGRSFLHSYDYEADTDFSTLELIMTAPMVVASWISLQYYGSTVDNRVFGSGDKTLHNVVGASIGVLEGNGGDLRVGLPLQSIHDGEAFRHEPMRLNVFLAAPIVAINSILERNPAVRELVDNGWLKLFALYDEGQVIARYAGDLEWVPTRETIG